MKTGEQLRQELNFNPSDPLDLEDTEYREFSTMCDYWDRSTGTRKHQLGVNMESALLRLLNGNAQWDESLDAYRQTDLKDADPILFVAKREGKIVAAATTYFKLPSTYAAFDQIGFDFLGTNATSRTASKYGLTQTQLQNQPNRRLTVIIDVLCGEPGAKCGDDLLSEIARYAEQVKGKKRIVVTSLNSAMDRLLSRNGFTEVACSNGQTKRTKNYEEGDTVEGTSCHWIRRLSPA